MDKVNRAIVIKSMKKHNWHKTIDSKELLNIFNFINKVPNNRLEPSQELIFLPFQSIEYDNLKVIIVNSLPFSLFTKNYIENYNLVKEAIVDYSISHNYSIFDISIDNLSKQGVLYLNYPMTTLKDMDSPHTRVWTPFFKKFLNNLSTKSNGLVFLLIGDNATALVEELDSNKHLILQTNKGLYKENHSVIVGELRYLFKQINNTLKDMYSEKITVFSEL